MKRALICAAAATAMLCAGAARAQEAPRFGARGLDLAAQDPAVKPGDDFFAFSQGKAVAAMQIPPERPAYGAFYTLDDLSQARGRSVVETAAANRTATGDEAKIGAFYRSFMDEDRVEARDARPMRKELAAIRRARSRDRIAGLMGRAQLGFGSSFFRPDVDVDAKAPTRYVAALGQAGLGLPDRDYYLQPSFAAQKQAYQAYVAQMLGLIGWTEPEANAKAIVELETGIAEASWTRAERRDANRRYNPMTPAQLEAMAPGFPWRPFLKSARLGGRDKIVVAENTAVPKIAAIFARTPVPVLQSWLAFSLADNAAPYLSKRFVQANWEFRSRALSGSQEQRPRWKRGVTVVGDQMGEAVGRVYVARYFPPESKAKMIGLVGDLRVAMQQRIRNLDWMSPETKAQALEKLGKFQVKIGYPETWRDYSALRISPRNLYSNVEHGVAFEWNRQVKRLDRPVDRSEWHMTPQTVNAYYSQTQNEIVFPAAILQPPFFDPGADMAVNYGAIGGVIGHEMTHGFDDQGRAYDGDGVLRDWWTAADAEKFKERAKQFGAQYAAFEVLPGSKLNPDLTMGENIADLGGLLLGLDAYHASLKGQPAPVIDGLTGDQRVFLGWAQVWRMKYREDFLKRLLVSDPHSPAMARVDMPMRNVDAWYAAFGVKPGDKLYLPPEQRARIW